MALEITKAKLSEIIDAATLAGDGDGPEQMWSNMINETFPNYELFWKYFVVPTTKRLDSNSADILTRIRSRDGINENIQNMMSWHYSTFLNLAYAHIHRFLEGCRLQLDDRSEIRTPSSFEDCYVHLGSACDVAEAFIQKIYFLILECHGRECKVLKRLNKDSFLELAEDWYDKNYEKVYEIYLRKGKPDWMRIPSAKNVLDEYYGDDKYWKDYKDISRRVREYRNVIVHQPQLGRLYDSQGNKSVPQLDKIHDYKKWSAFFSAVTDEERMTRDFVYASSHMNHSIAELERNLNNLWEKPIHDMKQLFLEEQNPILLAKYDLLLI